MDAIVDRFELARWVEEKLTARYGSRPHNPQAYDSDLLGALIATILSQHTSDLNSGRAYLSLKAAFPSGWNALRDTPVEEIADAIRSGGLADMKAPRIRQLAQEVYERTGDTTLECSARDCDADGERLAYLEEFSRHRAEDGGLRVVLQHGPAL